MMVPNHSLSLLSMLVLTATLLGCQPQNSNNTPQLMIVPNYNATYDAGEKSVTFQSKFLFGANAATTSAIQLKGGSVVKINDAQMKESSTTSSRPGSAPEYGYEYKLADVAPEALGKPFVFTYVDNDGRTYANEALIPQPLTAETPAEFERSKGLQIPFAVADQLPKNELVYAKLKIGRSHGSTAPVIKEGAKNGVVAMSAQELAGFEAGEAEITVCRRKIAEKVNAAGSGQLNTEYCLPTQKVPMK